MQYIDVALMAQQAVDVVRSSENESVAPASCQPEAATIMMHTTKEENLSEGIAQGGGISVNSLLLSARQDTRNGSGLKKGLNALSGIASAAASMTHGLATSAASAGSHAVAAAHDLTSSKAAEAWSSFSTARAAWVTNVLRVPSVPPSQECLARLAEGGFKPGLDGKWTKDSMPNTVRMPWRIGSLTEGTVTVTLEKPYGEPVRITVSIACPLLPIPMAVTQSGALPIGIPGLSLPVPYGLAKVGAFLKIGVQDEFGMGHGAPPDTYSVRLSCLLVLDIAMLPETLRRLAPPLSTQEFPQPAIEVLRHTFAPAASPAQTDVGAEVFEGTAAQVPTRPAAEVSKAAQAEIRLDTLLGCAGALPAPYTDTRVLHEVQGEREAVEQVVGAVAREAGGEAGSPAQDAVNTDMENERLDGQDVLVRSSFPSSLSTGLQHLSNLGRSSASMDGAGVGAQIGIDGFARAAAGTIAGTFARTLREGVGLVGGVVESSVETFAAAKLMTEFLAISSSMASELHTAIARLQESDLCGAAQALDDGATYLPRMSDVAVCMFENRAAFARLGLANAQERLAGLKQGVAAHGHLLVDTAHLLRLASRPAVSRLPGLVIRGGTVADRAATLMTTRRPGEAKPLIMEAEAAAAEIAATLETHHADMTVALHRLDIPSVDAAFANVLKAATSIHSNSRMARVAVANVADGGLLMARKGAILVAGPLIMTGASVLSALLIQCIVDRGDEAGRQLFGLALPFAVLAGIGAGAAGGAYAAGRFALSRDSQLPPSPIVALLCSLLASGVGWRGGALLERTPLTVQLLFALLLAIAAAFASADTGLDLLSRYAAVMKAGKSSAVQNEHAHAD